MAETEHSLRGKSKPMVNQINSDSLAEAEEQDGMTDEELDNDPFFQQLLSALMTELSNFGQKKGSEPIDLTDPNVLKTVRRMARQMRYEVMQHRAAEGLSGEPVKEVEIKSFEFKGRHTAIAFAQRLQKALDEKSEEVEFNGKTIPISVARRVGEQMMSEAFGQGHVLQRTVASPQGEQVASLDNRGRKWFGEPDPEE